MNSTEIRQKFLDYFSSKQHQTVTSSSLIPANDPSLLFTNAGMVPFKEVFLGEEQRPYQRAASIQRCLRAGGKHNDLENVGYTARHHTFFEMLGNFSFGDYFKRQAIQYAWEFLTVVLGLPAERLWITVFKDDSESENIWLKELKVNPQRFSRCDEKDNFWSMGNTGPCGPCSEIFYDHGAKIAGGPPGSPEQEGDRYVEIWNLVFMQYNRGKDGTLTPLEKQSIDTGMGLERLAAVLQGVHNNYDTDLFRPIIMTAATLSHCDDDSHHSLRVMADHIRATAFLITDGIRPSNEGRGYVLRRIIRRAVRHGHKLSPKKSFFYQLVEPLITIMGDTYPQLIEQQKIIEQTIKIEEQQFSHTLDQGMKVLAQGLLKSTDNTLPAQLVFNLYDTYGFPIDLTADIAREKGLTIDHNALTELIAKQKERSRASSQFQSKPDHKLELAPEGSQFMGYHHSSHNATITALFEQQQASEILTAPQQGIVVLDRTPFYAESGGQVGDRGYLRSTTNDAQFRVEDSQKQGNSILHLGVMVTGSFKRGETIHAEIDSERRQATILNHTATHLLHAALRQILGNHVIQKGSLVCPDYLRFDFSHPKAVTAQQLIAIEKLVNHHIRRNHQAQTQEMSPQQAQAEGAVALFGEKYGDSVRVLSVSDFSKELCGGTHVKNCGDIGLFKITHETGIAAGIRRIEAVTAETALDWLTQQEQKWQQTIQQQQDKIKQRDKELEQLKAKLHRQTGNSLLDQVQDIKGIKLLTTKLEQADAKALRQTLDQVKNKLGNSSVIVLATANKDSLSLIAGVSKDLTEKLSAGKLVNMVAAQVGGKGGGRPDMAQAGGNQPQNLNHALKSVRAWLEQQLN